MYSRLSTEIVGWVMEVGIFALSPEYATKTSASDWSPSTMLLSHVMHVGCAHNSAPYQDFSAAYFRTQSLSLSENKPQPLCPICCEDMRLYTQAVQPYLRPLYAPHIESYLSVTIIVIGYLIALSGSKQWIRQDKRYKRFE